MALKNVDSIIVRMYRIGTGDCLALKFCAEEKVVFKMLVDCGSCRGDSAKFVFYVKEINTFFENQLDLLLITHEHLDHIIGFSKAKTEFEKLKIKNVWLAWTEDDTNKLAKKLKKEYGIKLKALALSVQKLNNFLSDPNYQSFFIDDYDSSRTLDGKNYFLNGLTELLGLDYDTEELSLPASGGSKMAEAMNFIKEKKNGKVISYCYPGKVAPELSGLHGINFYILGPPENEALLKRDEVKEEVYERKLTFQEDLDFAASVTSSSVGSWEDSLFSAEYSLSGQDKVNFTQMYLESKEDKWRNIDLDWLGAAGKLAIRLERYMNNTSLAFAIEFTGSHKVLLFPGDAQSGNWISWHDENVKWEIKDGNKTKTIIAKDLLNSTVFYKVGHHMSHNGTASKSGLELMKHEDLVAFAPLDYNNILSGWKSTMPAPGVLEKLIKITKGRIFRIDEGLIKDRKAKAERDKMAQAEAIQFENSYKITDTYIEYVIKG
jgi:hypothetical protein